MSGQWSNEPPTGLCRSPNGQYARGPCNRDMTGTTRRVYTARRCGLSGDPSGWCNTILQTTGAPQGQPVRPNACIELEYNSKYGGWNLPDATCGAAETSALSWGAPGNNTYEFKGCTGVGQAMYEARLWGLDAYPPEQWATVCATTPGSPASSAPRPPDRCIFVSAAAGIYGHWDNVPDAACAGPSVYWGDDNGTPGYADGGCFSDELGARFRWWYARIWGLSGAVDTWCDIARTTPGEPGGIAPRTPNGCGWDSTNNAVYGVWVAADPQCATAGPGVFWGNPLTPTPGYSISDCGGGFANYSARLWGLDRLTDRVYLWGAIASAIPGTPGSIAPRPPSAVDFGVGNAITGRWVGIPIAVCPSGGGFLGGGALPWIIGGVVLLVVIVVIVILLRR